jgi:hypothetical protein
MTSSFSSLVPSRRLPPPLRSRSVFRITEDAASDCAANDTRPQQLWRRPHLSHGDVRRLHVSPQLASTEELAALLASRGCLTNGPCFSKDTIWGPESHYDEARSNPRVRLC